MVMLSISILTIYFSGCSIQSSNTPSQFQPAATTSVTSSKEASKPQISSTLLKTFSSQIHPSLPEYQFKLYGYRNDQRDGYSVTKILILKPGDQEEIIQELAFPDTYTPDKTNFCFYIEDLNFDGYKDLRIQEFLPAGPNVPYLYWTYDSTQKKYIPDKELSRISSPIIDHKNKMIISYTRSDGATHEKNYYQYIDGHITQTKMVEMKADPQNQVAHVTIKELKNGSITVTKFDKPYPIKGFEEVE